GLGRGLGRLDDVRGRGLGRRRGVLPRLGQLLLQVGEAGLQRLDLGALRVQLLLQALATGTGGSRCFGHARILSPTRLSGSVPVNDYPSGSATSSLAATSRWKTITGIAGRSSASCGRPRRTIFRPSSPSSPAASTFYGGRHTPHEPPRPHRPPPRTPHRAETPHTHA